MNAGKEGGDERKRQGAQERSQVQQEREYIRKDEREDQEKPAADGRQQKHE